jgi:hypothetical protein
MNALIESFDRLATRGTPRGADEVFAAARLQSAAQDTLEQTVDVGTVTDLAPTSSADFVTLAEGRPRSVMPRHLARVLLATAASLALLVAGIAIITHAGDDSAAGDLRDVDPYEAMSLAESALITPDEIGTRWRVQTPLTGPRYEEQANATIDAHPECAVLRSFGLFTPSNASAVARQAFTTGYAVDLQHAVFVFATDDDASRAMDLISGTAFAGCWFDLYDRTAPLGRFGGVTAATSEPWSAPAVSAHGDRQVIIGQKASYTTSGTPGTTYLINAFVQVGRAISWIAPTARVDAVSPLTLVERVIAATADALERAGA